MGDSWGTESEGTSDTEDNSTGVMLKIDHLCDFYFVFLFFCGFNYTKDQPSSDHWKSCPTQSDRDGAPSLIAVAQKVST